MPPRASSTAAHRTARSTPTHTAAQPLPANAHWRARGTVPGPQSAPAAMQRAPAGRRAASCRSSSACDAGGSVRASSLFVMVSIPFALDAQLIGSPQSATNGAISPPSDSSWGGCIRIHQTARGSLQTRAAPRSRSIFPIHERPNRSRSYQGQCRKYPCEPCSVTLAVKERNLLVGHGAGGRQADPIRRDSQPPQSLNQAEPERPLGAGGEPADAFASAPVCSTHALSTSLPHGSVKLTLAASVMWRAW